MFLILIVTRMQGAGGLIRLRELWVRCYELGVTGLWCFLFLISYLFSDQSLKFKVYISIAHPDFRIRMSGV